MEFTIHSIESAPAGARDTLGSLRRSYGFLPPLAGVLAEAPAVLNAYQQAMGTFDSAECALSPVERQVVLVAVSVSNRCTYCTAAHSLLARKHGLPFEEIRKIAEGASLGDARLEALRRISTRLTDMKGWVEDAEVNLFLEAGFEKRHVFEVILGVALKTLTNYANHVSNPPIPAPMAPFVPGWAESR